MISLQIIHILPSKVNNILTRRRARKWDATTVLLLLKELALAVAIHRTSVIAAQEHRIGIAVYRERTRAWHSWISIVLTAGYVK